MAISIPVTFVDGNFLFAAELNSCFTALSAAYNASGDTLLGNMNCNDFQFVKGRMENLSSNPASPAQGRFWWDTVKKLVRVYDGTAVNSLIPHTAMYNFLTGLTLSNNGTDPTNDIDIAVGACMDTTNAELMIQATAGLTKRLDAAWAVGDGNGGLDTGSIADNTYHIWLIKRSDTGVVDALFSLADTSPTMPTNYDFKRRIGSITRASGAIRLFDQRGDVFELQVQVTSVSTANPGTAAVTATATGIPIGIAMKAILSCGLIYAASPSVATYMVVAAPTTTDFVPSSASAHVAIGVVTGNPVVSRIVREVFTNVNGQYRYRVSASDANLTVNIETMGWIDRRGQDG